MSKVAWIGLGNMGDPMSRNVVKGGHEVIVWNRTKAKADPVLAAGAKWADSPKAAAEAAEYIFTMVSDGPTLQKVVLGDDGVLAGLNSPKIVVDMSTVGPNESLPVAEALEKKGCKFLRIPVTGSTIPAEKGVLGLLASGPKDAYDEVMPILECVGKNKYYLGPDEQARVMKIALNTMVANMPQLMAEALVLAERGGIKVEDAVEVIRGSALGNLIIESKVNPVNNNTYTPAAFSANMILKDLGLAMELAKSSKAALPVSALVSQFYYEAKAQGRGDEDYAVLVSLLEQNCGIER